MMGELAASLVHEITQPIASARNNARAAAIPGRASSRHIGIAFQAFYTTKSTGMGMGLSVCRSIIDAHGGRLWTGTNEPRGAVFQFTLPGAET
jgi:C4-dicarboxylate-specific signal transduction histidine kinase